MNKKFIKDRRHLAVANAAGYAIHQILDSQGDIAIIDSKGLQAEELLELLAVYDDAVSMFEEVTTEDILWYVSTDNINTINEIVDNSQDAITYKNFIQHVDSSLPTEEAGHEEWDKFYDLRWSISFNGEEIHIPNEAVSYNAFKEAIEEYYNEYN